MPQNKTVLHTQHLSKKISQNKFPSRHIICEDAEKWLKKQMNNSLGNIVTGIFDLDDFLKKNHASL